jgi:hypothetical protein
MDKVSRSAPVMVGFLAASCPYLLCPVNPSCGIAEMAFGHIQQA